MLGRFYLNVNYKRRLLRQKIRKVLRKDDSCDIKMKDKIRQNHRILPGKAKKKFSLSKVIQVKVTKNPERTMTLKLRFLKNHTGCALYETTISKFSYHIKNLSKCYADMDCNIFSVIQNRSDLFVIIFQEVM